MNKIVAKTASFVRRCFYHIFCLLPVKQEVILFESNLGRNYSGNPRAVYEEMVRQGLDGRYKLVYVMEDLTVKIPGRGSVVPRLRLSYYYYMAVAGTYIVDTRMPSQIKKRKKCCYIQTWHGTPLKKLALDMKDVNMATVSDIRQYHKQFLQDSKNWDFLVSQNAFSTEVFRRAFAFDKEMLEIGYPRNDVLIRENHKNAIVQKKERLGIPTDKKVLLYAPTWRDDEFTKEGNYRFEPKMDFQFLKEMLSDEYVLIVKYHYLIRDAIDLGMYSGFVYDFDASVDISELYLVSDALITDYSSVMFDYCILRRPIYFYLYDLEKYKNTLRGFYFDIEKEAPGPISRTTKELLRDILSYDSLDDETKAFYEMRYQKFCQKYCSLDDGMASQRLIDVVISQIS